MKFLQNWTIDLKKIPIYSSLKAEFNMNLDYKLLELIYHSNDPVFTEDRKKLLLPLLQAMKGKDNLKVRHANRYNMGRFYPDKSISPICVSRHIKHTLFSYLDWCDLDMVKGHPSILVSIAKNNNISLSYFENYLSNPEQIFTELCEYYSCPETPLCNDDIKLIFNLHIYGGGHQSWEKQMDEENKPRRTLSIHPFEKGFKNDCRLLIDLVYKNNKDIKEKVKGDLQDEYDIKKRVMSYFCGTIENEILYLCYKFLSKRGILKERKCALEFDGLCFENPYCDISEDINELNYHIKSNTNLDVKVKIKKYADIYIHNNIIEERNRMVDSEKADDSDENVVGVFTDKEAADKVVELYPHWVCCHTKLYVFDEDTGMWSDNRSSHFKIIQKLEKRLFVLAEEKETGEIYQTKKSYGNTVTLMERLPKLIEVHCVNNNWLKEKQYSSLGKILFSNGYYDFREECFHYKEDGFNPDIVFMGKIHHDFEEFTDKDMEYMEDIKQRFFIKPLGAEMGEYLILNFARGLAGDLMKRIIFGLGCSNSGKSVITSGMSLACGDYAGTFNAENLAYRNSSSDEAQIMRWAMLLRFKRLIFSNELKTTIQLNGNMIKKISSGGDPIVGRGHNSNEEAFVPHFLAMVMANDLPKIKPYDDAVDNRAKVVSYTREFVDNPTNEFELQKDDNTKEEIKTLRFQRALIGLLIQTHLLEKGKFEYEPAEVIISKENWISTDNNTIDSFLKDYEITNDEKDYVMSEDIDTWIKANELGISLKKFSIEMNKHATKSKYENVKSKDKKRNNKTKQAWFGIRRIVEIQDCFIADDENETGIIDVIPEEKEEPKVMRKVMKKIIKHEMCEEEKC